MLFFERKKSTSLLLTLKTYSKLYSLQLSSSVLIIFPLGDLLGGKDKNKISHCLYFISSNIYLTPRGILKMFLNDHFMWRFCMLTLWLIRSLPCALVLGWTSLWAIQVSITDFCYDKAISIFEWLILQKKCLL